MSLCPSEIHALCCDLMTLFLDMPGKPLFLALGCFNDELFLFYGGESHREVSWGLQKKKYAGAEAWERGTEGLWEKEKQLRKTLAEIMGRKGQEQGQRADPEHVGSSSGPWSWGGVPGTQGWSAQRSEASL